MRDTPNVAGLVDFLLQPEDHITRATVALSYPGTRDYVRRTTLDLQMPEPGTLPPSGHDIGGTPFAVVPIGYAYRGESLVDFSLFDGTGSKLSLLTRNENEDLTEAVLLEILSNGLRNERVDARVAGLARSDSADEWEEHLDGVLSAVFDHNEELARSRFSRPDGSLSREAELIARLTVGYILFTRVPDHGHRAIVTWKAEFLHDVPGKPKFPFPWTEPRQLLPQWWDHQREQLLLRWPRLTVEFPLAYAKSVHLEIELPDGVEPVEPEVGGGEVSEPTLRYRHKIDKDIRDGQWEVSVGHHVGSRIHIASPSHQPLPVQSETEVFVGPTRNNWLVISGILTGLTALIATLHALPEWAYIIDNGWPSTTRRSSTGTIAASGLIIPVVSLAIGVVNRRDEHELVNRVQGRQRPWMVTAATLLLTSAILSAMEVAWQLSLAFWSATAVTAGTLLVLQLVGWRTRDVSRVHGPASRYWPIYLPAVALAGGVVADGLWNLRTPATLGWAVATSALVEAVVRVSQRISRRRARLRSRRPPTLDED